MEFSDPYDPRVAFDDVYGRVDAPGLARPTDLAYAAGAIAHRARRRRLHAPPASVVGVSYDPTYQSFEAGGIAYRLIGDDATGLPLFDELHERFAAALPTPKHVRLDTEDSYADFRRARCEPYLASLEQRLSALEAAVAEHVADNHGGGKLAALQEAFDRHVAEHVGATATGGQRIALPLDACNAGLIEAWQDGPEILVSIRIPGPDGQARVATSATPAAAAVEETLGCAIAEDLEPEEIALVVPPVAQILGAGGLIPEICGVAYDLLGCSGGAPFVGVMLPASDPSTAAAMALLQRCQRGDRRACAEAQALEHSHRALVEDAYERLIRVQQMKAHGELP